MHGIDQIAQMDIFYHIMNYSSKGIIDAKSNYKAPTETSGSSSRFRGGGMLELNKMAVIEAKLDALMSKMSTQEMRSHLANVVGIEEGGE